MCVADVAVSAVDPRLNQPTLQSLLSSASGAASAYESSVQRWAGYLQRVLLAPRNQDMDMQWLAVKALQTLLNNWRTVPGVGEGVLPSYNNYDSGMWSWDTYLLRRNSLTMCCPSIGVCTVLTAVAQRTSSRGSRYKQAVGMSWYAQRVCRKVEPVRAANAAITCRFAPELSKNQLRLLVAGRDYQMDKLTNLSLPHM